MTVSAENEKTAKSEKKTASDQPIGASMGVGRKIAVVTWMRFQAPIMNPGLGSLSTYIKNQKPGQHQGGELNFFWPVGADYIYGQVAGGEMALIPLTNLTGWNVRL